jgi:hypothetical protein
MDYVLIIRFLIVTVVLLAVDGFNNIVSSKIVAKSVGKWRALPTREVETIHLQYFFFEY